MSSKMVKFLTRKWAKETGCQHHWHDKAGQWWRSHGNENWEFGEHGYMAKRYASINDQPIVEADRKLRWER